MKNVIIYNVLFRGIEDDPFHLNWSKCFGSYQEADEFMNEYAKNKRLKFRSEMGWTKGDDWDVDEMTIGAKNDYHLWSENRHSYFFETYVQEVKISSKFENIIKFIKRKFTN